MLADFRRRQFLLLEAESHIAEDVQVGEEGVMLEDGVHIAAVRRQRSGIPPVDEDLPALGPLESRHQSQYGGLSTSAGTQQRKEFSPAHLQRKILKRRMFPIALADALKFDNALR